MARDQQFHMVQQETKKAPKEQGLAFSKCSMRVRTIIISVSAHRSGVNYEPAVCLLPLVHFKNTPRVRSPGCQSLPCTSPLPHTPTHSTLPTSELTLPQEVRGRCEAAASYAAPQSSTTPSVATVSCSPDAAEGLT